MIETARSIDHGQVWLELLQHVLLAGGLHVHKVIWCTKLDFRIEKKFVVWWWCVCVSLDNLGLIISESLNFFCS